MSTATQARPVHSQSSGEPMLPCRIRILKDGIVDTYHGALPAQRHRSIHLGMLHDDSEGFVELTPGSRPPREKVQLNRRDRPEHFLPAGEERWLARALYHAERIMDGAYAHKRIPGGPREEVFVGVTARTERRAGRDHVAGSRWLWVDIDAPDKLPRLWEFLTQRPCHLLISSGGSGGVHAYWRLDRILPATRVDAATGELSEPIEQANGRLIHRVGGDAACRNRDRVMRLAGTRNFKRGEWARVIQADFVMPPYSLTELVGDLPDPEPPHRRHAAPMARATGDDPYRAIPAVEYMATIAGLHANAAGFVNCPNPAHPDANPSCHVVGRDSTVFICFSCGVSGGIFDLASLVLGGPTGPQLRGEAFKRARRLVAEKCGSPATRTTQATAES